MARSQRGSLFLRVAGQIVLDAMLTPSRVRPGGWVVRRIATRLRRFILHWADPSITYQLGPQRLVVPLSHDLPLHRRDYPDYSKNLSRVAAALLKKYPDMTCIDIGANVGDSVVLLREAGAFPVLCIEGSQEYLPYLEANTSGEREVVVASCLLGRRSGGRRGVLVSRSGTAHLAPASAADQSVDVITLPELLETYPAFARSRLVKIDTDGMDAEIILGAIPWLSSAMPCVLLEYDPILSQAQGTEPRAALEALRDIGYELAVVYDNTGEYLLTADLRDDRLLSDVDHHYRQQDGVRYADIAAMHARDRDVAEAIRSGELGLVGGQG